MGIGSTNAFWSKVYVKTLDECWEWEGTCFSKHGGGYGRFVIARKSYPANRVAYWLWNDVYPSDLIVCHKCDNPVCCNPMHLFLDLFLGTVADNMADRNAKGRQARGATHGSRTKPDSAFRANDHYLNRLTKQEVAEIKSLSHIGLKTRIIAKKYDISSMMVRYISHNKYWVNVVKCTEDETLELIRKLYRKG